MKFTNQNDDRDLNVLTFGQHKGMDIIEVPESYLLFMAHKFDKGSRWQVAADHEINRRGITKDTLTLSFGQYEGYTINELPDEYLKWCCLNLDDNPILPYCMEEAEERGLDLCEWDKHDPDLPRDLERR